MFLSKFNIMDYSLFFIIEANPDYSQKKIKKFRQSIKNSIAKREKSEEVD